MFTMKIDDVFEFTGGRTVFIGTPEGATDFIKACDCELWIGDVVAARLKFEPEMLPLRKQKDGRRALSTTTPITMDLNLIRAKNVEAWLKCSNNL